MRDDGADACEEGVTVVELKVEMRGGKACMRDDGADACEEGVTVVEVVGNESLYEG